ncbi:MULTISPECIES: hypothetical protein [Fischerella]|nr:MULTISPECIES: hypothetical protein [Fischerella]
MPNTLRPFAFFSAILCVCVKTLAKAIALKEGDRFYNNCLTPVVVP